MVDEIFQLFRTMKIIQRDMDEREKNHIKCIERQQGFVTWSHDLFNIQSVKAIYHKQFSCQKNYQK